MIVWIVMFMYFASEAEKNGNLNLNTLLDEIIQLSYRDKQMLFFTVNMLSIKPYHILKTGSYHFNGKRTIAPETITPGQCPPDKTIVHLFTVPRISKLLQH